jgi:hypothetical protein
MLARLPRTRAAIARRGAGTHVNGMFIVTEADAAAIRAAFDQGGEFAAALELRQLFPGINDNATACACARTIAGWKPRPTPRAPS